MNDKYTPSIRDAIDGIDYWRSEVAGLIELLHAEDPRQAGINKVLTRLRVCSAELSAAMKQEGWS